MPFGSHGEGEREEEHQGTTNLCTTEKITHFSMFKPIPLLNVSKGTTDLRQ